MAQGTELITASRTARSEIGAIRCHLNSNLTDGYQRPFFLLASISLVRTEADKVTGEARNGSVYAVNYQIIGHDGRTLLPYPMLSTT